MTRENSLRIAVIVAVLTTTVTVAAIGLGTSSVGGYAYDVGEIDDLGISSDENQVISDIAVHSDSDPISIHVGELSDTGAKLDQNSSSYQITNGQSASENEVYITNPNSSDATIVIEPSALDGTSKFDLIISGIDTTNVSLDPSSESTINSSIEYQVVQNMVTVRSSFTLSTSSNLTIDSFDARKNTVNLTDVSLENENESYIVIWKLGPNGELDSHLGEVQGRQGNISVEIDELENNTQIAAAVHPNSATPNYEIIHALNSKSVTIPTQLEVERVPIHYNPQSHYSDSLNSSVIEIIFNSKIDESGSISIESNQSQDIVVNLKNQTNAYNIQDRRLILFPSKLDTGTGENISGNIQAINLHNISPEDEGYSISDRRYNVQSLSKTLSNGSSVTIGQGDQIAFESTESGPFQIELTNNSDEKILRTDLPTPVIPYDTTELNIDEYSISNSSFTRDTQLKVEELVINTEMSRSEFWNNESINLSIQTVPAKRDLSIELRNESGYTISQNSIFTDGSNTTNISLKSKPPGNYTLHVIDRYSQTESRYSIPVIDPKPPTISVDDDEKSLGDTASLDIVSSTDTNTTSITITESNTNDSIATATVTSPRGESTSLRFNTYAAGDPELESDLFSLDGPGTIESVTTSTTDGTIPAGEYTVTATAEPSGPTDTATLTLRNRSTNGLSVYSTAESDVDAFSTAGTVTDAITNGTLAPAGNVTEGDTVVYAVNATGLSGYTAVRDPTLETGADLDRLDGLEFTVSNESETDPNATPATTADGKTVLTHGTGLFLVGNATETLTESLGTSAETDLEATFTVVDERLRAAAGSNASHAGSARFTHVPNATDADETDDGDESVDSDSTSDDQETTSSDDTADSENTTDFEGTTDSENTTDSDEVTDSENTTDSENATELNDTTDSDGSIEPNDVDSSNDSTTDGNETTTDEGVPDGDDVNDSTAGDTTDGDSDDLEGAGETVAANGSNDSGGSVDGTDETSAESDPGDEDVDSDGADLADEGAGADERGTTDSSEGSGGADPGGSGGGATSGGGDSSGATGGGATAGGGSGGTGDDAGGGGRGGNDGTGSDGGNGEDAERSGSSGASGGGSADGGSRSDSESPGSTPDADDGAEPGQSTDRDPDTPGIGGDDAGDPGSSSTPATDGRPSGDAPSRASAVRAAEERALRDRNGIGPRPVADSNAPEESEYVSRHQNASYAPAAAATAEGGHDDPQSLEATGEAEPGTPSDDRAERPPTFEEAPLRSTAYDVPGFGVPAALLAITAVTVVAGRCGTS